MSAESAGSSGCTAYMVVVWIEDGEESFAVEVEAEVFDTLPVARQWASDRLTQVDIVEHGYIEDQARPWAYVAEGTLETNGEDQVFTDHGHQRWEVAFVNRAGVVDWDFDGPPFNS